MEKDYILKKLEKSNLLSKGDIVVLGFSGGPDSVFLFEIFKLYKEKIDPSLEIVLAHVNHMLRGADADSDEAFCKNVAAFNGVKYFCKKVDLIKLGKELKIGSEELGRDIRYGFFQEVLKEVNGTKIALAHNKDDQIETFLFRLMRGTSLEGLEGIKKQRENYIRPILDYYKEGILKYLHENKIEYVVDKTNYENEYTRNSIRLDLIPFMEKRYNAQVKDKIYQLITEIQETNRYLKVDLSKYITDDKLSIEKMQKEDKIIQRKIIKEFLNWKNIKSNRYQVELIAKLLDETGNKKVNLEKNIFLKKEYDFFTIERFSENNSGSSNGIENQMEEINIQIKKDEEIIFEDYVLEIKIEKNDKNKNSEKNSDIFFTNLKINDIITIRHRKNGDKFIPQGMSNHKKIKDFFIDEKIPKEERDRVPIVLCKSEIVWIAGFRGSELFKREKDNEKDYEIVLYKRRNI